MSQYSNYRRFLKNNNIKTFGSLFDVFCYPPHNMVLSHCDDTVTFVRTEFTREDNKLGFSPCGLVLAVDRPVSEVVFVDMDIDFVHKNSLRRILQMDVTNCKVYNLRHRVLLKMFSYKEKWYCLKDIRFPCVTAEDDLTPYLSVASLNCNLSVKLHRILDPDTWYYFLVEDCMLNRVYESFKPTIYLWKSVNSKTKRIESSAAVNAVLNATFTSIRASTKYQLEEFVERNENKTSGLLIEYGKRFLVLASELYLANTEALQKIYSKSLYKTFIGLRRNDYLSKYVDLFLKTKSKMICLNNYFSIMIDEIYDAYVSRYVLYNHVFEDDFGKNELLFEIHYFSLQVNCDITKGFVEQVVLYCTHWDIVENLLKDVQEKGRRPLINHIRNP